MSNQDQTVNQTASLVDLTAQLSAVGIVGVTLTKEAYNKLVGDVKNVPAILDESFFKNGVTNSLRAIRISVEQDGKEQA